MSFIKKNGIIALLIMAVIYVYAPPIHNDAVRLPWLDEIKFIITSLAPAKPDAGVTPVDPAAAAQAVEDVDYRMAQRDGSIEGWRSFLSAHEKGLHAQSAQAEVEKLLRAEKPPTPAAKPPAPAAAVSNGEPGAAKAAASAPTRPSPTEATTLAADDICRRDLVRLGRLAGNPTIDEAMRFENELGCERLRPELFRLTERLDYDAPGVAVAPPSPPSKVGSAHRAGRRATESRTRWTVSSRSLQPRPRANRCLVRSACSSRPPSLPPILVALFGNEPRNSTAFVWMRISGGAGGVAGTGSVGGAGSTGAAAGGAAAGNAGGPGGGGNAGSGGGDGDGNGNGNGHGGGGGGSGSNGAGGNGGGGGGGH